MTITHPCSATLCLSREEAWAVHAALVAHVERELEDGGATRVDAEHPSFAEHLIQQVEAAGGALDLDPPALQYLRERLETHLERGPDRDADHVRAVLDAIEAALRAGSGSAADTTA